MENLETIIQEQAQQAVNPLHNLVLIATVLTKVLALEYGKISMQLPELELPYADRFLIDQFPQNDNDGISYPTKELGGIAGLYQELLKMGYTVIFANDFALNIHGIDVVAIKQEEGKYIICEAKGTGSKKIKNFSHYLKKTKDKGRQMTWEWCWASLVDFALQAGTAGIFLKLLEPFLEEKVSRLISVTRLARCQGGYVVRESKIWVEEEISAHKPFAEKYDLSKQMKWYREIQTISG